MTISLIKTELYFILLAMTISFIETKLYFIVVNLCPVKSKVVVIKVTKLDIRLVKTKLIISFHKTDFKAVFAN